MFINHHTTSVARLMTHHNKTPKFGDHSKAQNHIFGPETSLESKVEFQKRKDIVQKAIQYHKDSMKMKTP